MDFSKSSLCPLNSNLINSIYPVGAIFITINNTNPGNYITNTVWVLLKDRFLLGAGDTYIGGNTGGEATHILTTSEMPSHNHELDYNLYGSRSGYGFVGTNSNKIETGYLTMKNTGGGQAHNNMPPYLVVYMWKRTK